MSDPAQNLALTRQYLKAIESGAPSEQMARFFDPEFIVEIFPSSFFPKGSRSNLEETLTAGERGKKVMSKQTYEVTNALATGDQVAMELLWTGTLLIPFQSIPAGAQMRAHFAMFLLFKNGKIIQQRNYDCYDPA